MGVWMRTRHWFAIAWLCFFASLSLHAKEDTPSVEVGDTAQRPPLVTWKAVGAGDELLLSSDGNVVATYSRYSVTLWNCKTGKRIGTTIEHRHALSAVLFSPDGSLLATAADREPGVHLWDTATGKERAPVETGGKEPTRLAFSADGKRLLSTTSNVVTAYDLASRKPLFELRGHDEHSDIYDVAASGDGKQFATGGADGSVRVWDAASGKQLHVLRGPKGAVYSVAYSPDGKALASCTNSICILWDPHKGEEITRVAIRGNGRLRFLAGTKSVVIESSPIMRVDFTTGSYDPVSEMGCFQAGVASSKNFVAILTKWAGQPGSITLLANTTQELFSISVEAIKPRPQLSDDGSVLAFFAKDDELQVLDVEARLAQVTQEKDLQRALVAKQAQEEAEAARHVAEQQAKETAALEAEKEARRRKSLPTWEDYEDLGALTASFPADRTSSLEHFVRYGTPKNAERAVKGDRFDREEAAEEAARHVKELPSRRFFVQTLYRYDETEGIGHKRDAVRLRVPLDFRGRVPAHDPNVDTATYIDHEPWFLTKTGMLEPCANGAKAELVVRNGGVLYVPESLDTCELVLWVRGDRAVQKNIARAPERHVVNIAIACLRVERPLTKGFFKVEAVRANDYASGSLLTSFQNGNNGPEGQPNYFVQAALKPGQEAMIPEVVVAVVERVEIVDIGGDERKVVFSWDSEK